MSRESQCILRFWRGYDVRIHPEVAYDEMQWETELASLENWMEENTALPAVDFIEIRPKTVLIVFKGIVATLVLIKTHLGLKEEVP